ncbi:MAG: hypothetical protein IT454_17765 [Planctomycetes bacterium]|nr:hypothetical protein [Planctomycetota bacterium]
MRFLRHFALLLALLGVSLPAPAQRKPATETELSARAVEELERLIHEPQPSFEDWEGVQRAALAAHGESTLLVKALEQRIESASTDDATRRELLRGLTHVLHREGRLEEALAKVDAALALGKSADLLLRRAQLLDALAKVDDALAAYEELRASSTDGALIGRIELRMALLEATKSDTATASKAGDGPRAVAGLVALRPASGSAVIARAGALGAADAGLSEGEPIGEEGPESPLYRYAKQPGRERELVNRAAVVLAMLGRPNEALALFQTSGEGSELFRQEIRLAEWALAAKAPTQAQEHAWKARGAATLKRDRLYALAVLVEAHRADESLPALIDKLARTPDLDADSRSVWIDLLRETARVDEALRLFREGAEQGFTAEMRRELLEMCREAGRDQELIATYGELIEAEPRVIEWREGLSRYWLERGQRTDAEAVWTSLFELELDVPHTLEAARAARDLGLESIARRAAERCFGDTTGGLEARMFLFELEVRAGRVEKALEELEAFDRAADASSPLRLQLAEAFERIGQKRRAVDVLEAIRQRRGADEAEEDLEMRLAWLLSEVGDERTALERWRNLWRRVSSLSRRRQVEDRLLAVASRLGNISDIAVELEEKLADGRADDRDAALLIRLYMKVGDPVSAAEIVDEHMKQKGGDPLATLQEKARVYLGGKDYYHFEKTVRKLIDVDPENKGDHLRQLAMSNLERGKPQEARAVLEQLARDESPSDAAEFEAGVLTLAGLHEDAARTYRRGLAAHPERIDSNLLLANTMRTLRQTERAIGMFQYLAENADKDDLFTVAIDGLLNMRAREPHLRWALRVTLERLAARHDKMYLYQLVADLCDELKDNAGRMRALEGSLAIAAEQRAQVLRELMDVSQGDATNSYTVVNGVLVQRRTGGDDQRRLAYGRRLIGLDDVVPPQVYLELGESFLRGGEISNASKTFSMARDVPDYAAFQRQVAQSFENEQFIEHALGIYERSMASQGVDVGLLLKTGELHEQLGRDERAAELYLRGIDVLISRHPLATASAAKKKEQDEDDYWGWNAQNVGEFERYLPALRSGFIASASSELVARTFADQRASLEADLRAAMAEPKSADPAPVLESFPRLLHRADLLRQLALRFGLYDEIDALDLELLRAFEGDTSLLERTARERAKLGFTERAQRLVEASGRPEAERKTVLAGLGIAGGTTERAGLALADVVGRLLPTLVEGDRDKASTLLRSVRLGDTTKDDLPQLQLLVSAALFLDDDGAIVQLGRHTVRALVQHGQGYESREQVEAILKRAKGAVDAESYGLVVDALVEALNAKKEAFPAFSYTLRRFQRELGRPLFTLEQIEKQIEDCLPDKTWLASSLIELCPPEARLDLVQRIWSKVPATAKADMALDVLTASAGEVSNALAEFVVGGFQEGLEKTDDPQMLTYGVRNAFETARENLGLVERIAAIAAKKFPTEVTFAATLAAARAKLGRDAEALTAMRATLPLIAEAEEEWDAREASEALVAGFVPRHTEELSKEIEALEAKSSNTARFAELRTQIYEKLGDEQAAFAVLEQAYAKRPDDLEAIRALYHAVSAGDDEPRRLALLEKIVAKEKSATWWRSALVSSWQAARNPLRALEVKRKGEGAPEEKHDEGARKLGEATLEEVSKAIDAGQAEDARATYRRTWRRYGQTGESRFAFYGFSGSRELVWPSKERRATERTRGGLDDLKLDQPLEKEERKSRDAYEVLAEQGFGLGELRRQVRSLGESELQSSRGLLRGLQRAEVATSGGERALATWVDATRRGDAGTVERALLLSYFEDHIDSLGPDDRALVAQLTPAVHPLDGAQLRALARLQAKLGDSARTSRIYQWCATLATSSRWGAQGRGSISAHELLEEVPKYLQGQELLDAVGAILSRCDPGGYTWERDGYFQLVLQTWLDIGGPAKARERCAKELETVLDLQRGLMREPAQVAAKLLARSGDFERGVRALEIALCRFDASQVVVDPEDVYSLQWKLQPQSLGSNEVRELFPVQLGSGLDDARWIELVARAALRWHAEKRLQTQAAELLFSALAVRARALQLDVASELVDRVAELGANPDSDQHLVLDLQRLVGREAQARAIEDDLLARQCINPQRLPELWDRVRPEVGPERTYELFAHAAEFAPHPEIVARLISTARELGRAEDVARLEQLREASLAAAKELEVEW